MGIINFQTLPHTKSKEVGHLAMHGTVLIVQLNITFLLIVLWTNLLMLILLKLQYWPFYYVFYFFYKKSQMNPFVHLSNVFFFQYTDTEVRLENWKTLNSAILSSRVSNSILEWLNGPTGSRELFF